jgi:D-alanyl-D-alanine carboxypeptidase
LSSPPPTISPPGSGHWLPAACSTRAYQRRWLDSLRPVDPSKPDGQQYRYGISQLRWGPNTIYFHGGETPGWQLVHRLRSHNQVTLVIWTNLTVSLDEQLTANASC